jgi:putative endonuclease
VNPSIDPKSTRSEIRDRWNAACFDPRMSNARQRLGNEGESIACAELEKLGYSIIERNYRTRSGEIDIVANDAGTVVFVEVKTKTSGDFGDPVEEVTAQKQRQIVSMGEFYATYCCPPNTPCRFDVVTVDLSMLPPRITLYKDAFRPGW